MLIEHNPDDWETVTEHHICSFHKEHPEQRYPGCTCFSSYGMKRKDDVVCCGSALIIAGGYNNG